MVAIYSEIPISGFSWELVDFNTKWVNFDTDIVFMESMKFSIKWGGKTYITEHSVDVLLCKYMGILFL
jgi:hypothetical protein